MLKIYSKRRLNTHMTECLNGRELLTRQQMTAQENWLSRMDLVIECLRDLDLEPINDCLSPNLARFALNLQTSQRKLLLDLLTLYQQIKSSLLNPLPKEEKDTSMNSASKRKPYPCLDGTCPQCNNDFSSFPGLKSLDTESQARKSP